jgi:hypothetical protein
MLPKKILKKRQRHQKKKKKNYGFNDRLIEEIMLEH